MPAQELIGRYFSSFFSEIADGVQFSSVINHSIAEAPALGLAQRLIIFECDFDGLNLSSVSKACWVVDSDGFYEIEDRNPFSNCPLSSDYPGWHDIRPKYFVQNPYLRFNTKGSRIRVGINLGPNWYVTKEGPLDESGLPVSEFLATHEFKGKIAQLLDWLLGRR